MDNLSYHPYFTEWTEPSSGIKSFVLTKMLAPIQQSFYFTNSSLSADEKYLWFYATYPPSPVTTRTLGVVGMDPDNPFIQIFPETAFWDASPLVTPEGDSVYFFQGKGVSKFCMAERKVEKVCELDDKYIAGRHLFRGATHLTLSADGKQLLIDGQVGNKWFVSVGNLETGKIEIVNEFSRMYNHAQFSPVNPKLFSMAQDWWSDPITGQTGSIDHRIWVMDTDRTMCYPITPKEWSGHGYSPSHEWWSKDGKLCWTDYNLGAFQFDVETEEKIHIWKHPLCHTHCDSTRRYWCADQTPYRWEKEPCMVLFYDHETEKETLIASLPQPEWPRKIYHTDPHPQFSPSDRYVVYSTTVAEGVSIALCPTSQFK